MKSKAAQFEDKIHQKEENVARVQWEREQQIREKMAIEGIKRNDKRETVERIQRMQEY